MVRVTISHFFIFWTKNLFCPDQVKLHIKWKAFQNPIKSAYLLFFKIIFWPPFLKCNFLKLSTWSKRVKNSYKIKMSYFFVIVSSRAFIWHITLKMLKNRKFGKGYHQSFFHFFEQKFILPWSSQVAYQMKGISKPN